MRGESGGDRGGVAWQSRWEVRGGGRESERRGDSVQGLRRVRGIAVVRGGGRCIGGGSGYWRVTERPHCEEVKACVV